MCYCLFAKKKSLGGASFLFIVLFTSYNQKSTITVTINMKKELFVRFYKYVSPTRYLVILVEMENRKVNTLFMFNLATNFNHVSPR